MTQETKAIYTDGGLLSKNPSDVGGMWAWCGVDRIDGRPLVKGHLAGGVNVHAEQTEFESGVVLATPSKLITNNIVEMLAVIKALEFQPEGWSGIVYSDSEVTLGRLLHGHALRGLPANAIERFHKALARVGEIKGVLLQGHPTKKDLLEGFGKKRGFPVSKWNVWVDAECNRLAEQFKATKAGE